MKIKQLWNQQYIDEYDKLMNRKYQLITDILKEKIGEQIHLMYANENVDGILEEVNDGDWFIISINDKKYAVLFINMSPYPFYENNEILMNTVVDFKKDIGIREIV